MNQDCPKTVKRSLRHRLIRHLVAHAIKDKLPPERELSETLGVNRYLLRNCMNEMEREGQIVRIPRKGTFLNMIHRAILRVGVVVADGQTSSYVDAPLIFSGLLETLERRNCLTRIINYRNMEEIPHLLDQYGLCGCVWLTCMRESLEEIVATFDEATLRRMSFVYSEDPLEPGKLIHGNYVARDYDALAMEKIAMLHAGGHTRIAYLSAISRSYDLTKDAFHANGIEWREECVISNAREIPEKLPYLVEKYGINAIICNGSNGMYENLFKTLHQRPDYQPFLCIENNMRVRVLMKEYPQVKVNFIYADENAVWKEMGALAGGMLVDTIETGEIQPPRLVYPKLVQAYKERIEK